MRRFLVFGAATALVASAGPAMAQDVGTLDPKPLAPLASPFDPHNAAKQAFGRETTPAALPPRSIGFYSKGCLAGGRALPTTGPEWQVMRLSRNRNWGNPVLIDFLERLARQVPAKVGWPGILVGDIAQPRGGPMLGGHASHQIGLDADIWLAPMPNHELSRTQREFMASTNVVEPNRLDVDARKWTPGHLAMIRLAAQQPEVERIFVNPAIKKAICRQASGDRSWLSKVRPMYGHDYHFHVRIKCPPGQGSCQPQAPVPLGDGCDKSLAYWFSDAVLHPRLNPHWKPPLPMTVAQLPDACRQVLEAR